ncbi:MAG: hypothetical protein ACTHN0_09625 [Aquihabitans sp.]
MDAAAIDSIEFAVVFGVGHVPEVRVAVNGVDLIETVGAFEQERGYDPAGSYGGLIPTIAMLGPMSAHFLGGRGQTTPVLACACGEWGCWPLEARIEAADDVVRWDAFSQPHRPGWSYDGLGPFTFRRSAYEAGLAQLEQDLLRAGDGRASADPPPS